MSFHTHSTIISISLLLMDNFHFIYSTLMSSYLIPCFSFYSVMFHSCSHYIDIFYSFISMFTIFLFYCVYHSFVIHVHPLIPMFSCFYFIPVYPYHFFLFVLIFPMSKDVQKPPKIS